MNLKQRFGKYSEGLRLRTFIQVPESTSGPGLTGVQIQGFFLIMYVSECVSELIDSQ